MSVNLSAQPGVDNTSHGVGGAQMDSVHYVRVVGGVEVTTILLRDAKAEKVILKRVQPDGTDSPGFPTITLDLNAIAALGLSNVDLAIRVLRFKDPSNACAPMKMGILGTVPEADV